jgi:hypothetical protein
MVSRRIPAPGLRKGNGVTAAHQGRLYNGHMNTVSRTAVALACLPLVVVGCGGSSNPGATHTGGQQQQTTGQQQTAGSYTAAFAQCMRAHGVPNFPDPSSQGGPLGPDSGVDPTSPQFQAALNGPCKSLAPPGWVSGNGPASAGGGS